MDQPNLEAIWELMNQRLSHLGDVVIAGGAVRDYFLKREPKDYDVFLLSETQVSTKTISDALSDLDLDDDGTARTPRRTDETGSDRFATKNLSLSNKDIQLIWYKAPSVGVLLDEFDWNICRFAYTGTDYVQLMDPAHIGQGQRLVLHDKNTPLSTLRRGYIFSQRYDMVFDREDQIELCRLVYMKTLSNAATDDEEELEEMLP
jgi:hypothetical protein